MCILLFPLSFDYVQNICNILFERVAYAWLALNECVIRFRKEP